MCGIAVLSLSSPKELRESLQTSLARRGPDSLQTTVSSDCWLCGAVLSIQGYSPTPQPVLDDSGNALLWNGEVFGPSDLSPEGDECDTLLVARLLAGAVGDALDPEDGARRVAAALGRVEGPFAFVFLCGRLGALFCGRDPIGRRSLLAVRDEGTNLIGLASVSVECGDSKLTWEELPPHGVVFCSLSPGPWQPATVPWPSRPCSLGRLPANLEVPRLGEDAAATAFLETLEAALRRRLRRLATGPDHQTCRVGVLFSGGVDSALLAAVLSRCLPQDEPIDLINVSFFGGGGSTESPSPDRLAGIACLLELQVSTPALSLYLP